jgi:hypothetical protein
MPLPDKRINAVLCYFFFVVFFAFFAGAFFVAMHLHPLSSWNKDKKIWYDARTSNNNGESLNTPGASGPRRSHGLGHRVKATSSWWLSSSPSSWPSSWLPLFVHPLSAYRDFTQAALS